MTKFPEHSKHLINIYYKYIYVTSVYVTQMTQWIVTSLLPMLNKDDMITASHCVGRHTYIHIYMIHMDARWNVQRMTRTFRLGTHFMPK